MAYALLAGMQPVYGLWTAIVPMVLYCFLGMLISSQRRRRKEEETKEYTQSFFPLFIGGSRELSVGPSAMLSLTIPAAISHIVEEKFANDQNAYHQVASTREEGKTPSFPLRRLTFPLPLVFLLD